MTNTSEALRVIAIAILRRGGDILVMPVENDDGSIRGWRPLGGGVEFGETADVALRREMMEEIGVVLSSTRLIGVFESIFQRDGRGGHEIVFVFEAATEDAAFMKSDTVLMNENGEALTAHWVCFETFKSGRNVLYPNALIDLI